MVTDFEVCRRISAQHGRSYYLATRLLPAWKRPYVHALYAFARCADDIVDDLASTASPDEKDAALRSWLAEDDHPVVRAFRVTLGRWDIPPTFVDEFLVSMRMDLTVTGYQTFEELGTYVRGSAAVIGLQMLPILEPLVPLEIAAPYAEDLGVAFQLTNFLRDIGEDLQRGRVYLPQEDLDAYGVTVEQLSAGVVDQRFRELMAFELARTRELYRTAALGIRLLHPTSRPCIDTALKVYGGILRAIEDADYQVLDRRVTVPLSRRLVLAGPALARSAVPRRSTS